MRALLRWVLWDVKDTLLKVRSSVGEQYCDEAKPGVPYPCTKRMGLSLNPAEVDAAFRQAYRHHSSTFPNYGITQGLDGQSWWKAVVKATFSLCKVQDPAILKIYQNFRKAENWEVFPDSKVALENCSLLGLRFLVTSEGAGVEKPEAAIFNQALRKCGVPAASVAHVGDHYVNNYLASRSVGIHGFLLDRKSPFERRDVPKEHRLSSLDELPVRLKQHMDAH
ncbi:haloacid dehalogenase-like hydrolase domain-containing protein 3 [Nerophis ophidion]|uniref:haloacid dehalogenase-like hydrolase domain-containing protein 3 n=1 Tax=Nerophis ophidion TaxID=159077 RepID=UPI002AE0951B|nr:haloacid dehalogenase-like hydrolase domain-containing protein 3 [Nerophis ophidion]